MTLIYSVILVLLFKSRGCQLQCVEGTPNATEFSINVTTHIEVGSGDCIRIPYDLTFPKDEVRVPYKKIWFKGDEQNTKTVNVVDRVESGTRNVFRVNGLPRGEYEYGFKLEWGCNQTYIFPERVRISVSASTKKPRLILPVDPMKEGKAAILKCNPPILCPAMRNISWKWTKADGSVLHHVNDSPYVSLQGQIPLSPTADDHNTNITCVVEHRYSIIETTVTLIVKFAPKILNGSRCVAQGNLLVCECISRGNPLPPITWPSASPTDFSVTSSSSIQTVTSTITMLAADYHNTTVTCVSTNELGRDETEIPVQNYTEFSSVLGSTPTSDAVAPWTIAGVSLILNVVLLTSLIICYKRGKSQQMELGTEMNTYASLNRADIEPAYSVISPQNRDIT